MKNDRQLRVAGKDLVLVCQLVIVDAGHPQNFPSRIEQSSSQPFTRVRRPRRA